MSRKIEIGMVRIYRVIDNETGKVVFESLDYKEAEREAGFSRPESMIIQTEYSLSDCVNYETNVMGDCGGRVEAVYGVVICETCRNRKV